MAFICVYGKASSRRPVNTRRMNFFTFDTQISFVVLSHGALGERIERQSESKRNTRMNTGINSAEVMTIALLISKFNENVLNK